jgi:hypothetical protein
LADGTIVAAGTHDQLLDSEPRYGRVVTRALDDDQDDEQDDDRVEYDGRRLTGAAVGHSDDEHDGGQR